MRRDDDNGISYEYKRGWGSVILTIVGVSAVVFIGAWALLSVALRSIDTAAVVMIVTMFAIVILVGLPGLGMFAANVIQRNTIENVRARENMQDVIDATPRQLPQPASWIVNGSTMQREERVQAAAQKVYMALKPENIPPTRANIARVTGESSHEFAATVIDWLAERGHVEGGAQGKAPMWRQ